MKKTQDKSSSAKIVVDKIEKALKAIRPSLKADGGDVEFVEFNEENGIVKVRLIGMCAHCPMSQITLKDGIEDAVRREAPEVKGVIAI